VRQWGAQQAAPAALECNELSALLMISLNRLINVKHNGRINDS
jgi:hypothetical protein